MSDYDMTIKQGATFTRVITWYQSDGTTPNDLTGYTAKMHLKRKYTDETEEFALTTENGRITLGGTAGTVTLSIPATNTDDLNGKYRYELKLISGSYVKSLIEGEITISPEITKLT